MGSLPNLLTIVLGGVALGVIARAVLRGRLPAPIWATVGSGVLGMVAGNVVATVLGVATTSGIDWIRHALQVAGALVAIAIVAGYFRSRQHNVLRERIPAKTGLSVFGQPSLGQPVQAPLSNVHTSDTPLATSPPSEVVTNPTLLEQARAATGPVADDASKASAHTDGADDSLQPGR
ncbi:MAG: hypothetical protein WCI29_06685 [Actinomycetes bacterium]